MQIPTLNEQTRLSPSSPVDVGSSGYARSSGEAISDFGNSMAKASETMRNAQNQIDETKTKEEMQQAMSDARENAIRMGKPDGSDYQEVFDKELAKRVPRITEKIGDPNVYRNVQIDYERQRGASLDGLKKAAYQAQQNYVIQGNEEIISMRERRAFNNPELAALDYTDFRDNHLKELQDKGILSAESAMKVDEIARQRMSSAYIDGLLYNKKFKEAASVLNATEQDATMELSPEDLGMYGLKSDGTKMLPMIDSKSKKELSPEASELLRGLKPNQREAALNKLRESMERETRVKMRTISDGVQAYTGFAMSGEEMTASEKARVKSMVNSVPDDDIRAQYQDQLAMADKISPLVYVAKNGSPKQLEDSLAKFEQELGPQDNTVRGYHNQAVKQKALDAIRKVQEQTLKDPLADANNDETTALLKGASKTGQPEDMQKYLQRALEVQSYRGIPAHKQRVTTEGEAQGIADSLRASLSVDPAVAAKEIENLDARYGKHFEKMITEVVARDKSVPESLILAGQVTSPGSRKEILENIQKKSAIETAFDQRTETSKKDLQAEVTTAMDRFSAALGSNLRSADGLSVINRFQEQIGLQAKKNMAMRQMDPETAVEEAYKTIVQSNFDIVDTGKSQLIMPKKSAYNPELVERFTNDFEPDSGNYSAMQIMGVEPTESMYQAKLAEKPNLSREQMRDSYRANVLANGKWVTNADQSGIVLVVPQGQREIPVYRNNGTPIEFTYRELGNYTNPREFTGLRK